MKLIFCLFALGLPVSLCFGWGNKQPVDPTLNLVLDNMLLAQQSLQQNDYSEAKIALDSVLNNIEAVWGEDEAAKQARSLWYEEGSKGFKGEPYERVMAYLYRGLIYIQDGDLENARVCFRLAYLQDSFPEEEQPDCDFATIYLLLAWVDYQLGQTDRAEALLDTLAAFRPDLTGTDLSKPHLLFVETGKAPRKLRDGVSQNRLVYRRGKNIVEQYARFQTQQGGERTVTLMDNLYFQAASRGGRPIDGIIEGKVAFKSTVESASDVMGEMASAGMLFSSLNASGDLAAVSGGLAILGFVGHGLSGQVNAKADIRAWNNLPDCLHLCFLNEAEFQSIQTVEILAADHSVVRQLSQSTQNDRLLWIR